MPSNNSMGAEEWQHYRDKFRRFIESSESGMLLDADDEYYHRFGESSEGRAGFKLQNGQVVKKFITIWELFEHSLEFKECIANLALKAAEIYERVHFSKIITATLVAEELCDYVFDQLKNDVPDIELSTYHFGDYPTVPLTSDNSGQFKDEKTLILTDIIDTGSLVKHMAESILKQGAQSVSILAVAITKEEWVEYQRATDTPFRIQFNPTNPGGARLHNLTDCTIIPLEESDYDADKLIPIDYSSVLPENGQRYDQHYFPAFSIRETFEHLERAGAFDFSFYKFDDRRRTCALIVPKLLKTCKTEIWNKIRELILSANVENQTEDDALLLVTTYKQKDIYFKDFIENCLNEEGIKTATGITLKRSVKDLPSRNLTLGARGRAIQGKEVILILATLSTTERLRNLISLLVSYEVKKITAVCLINEAGPLTTEFINAIERFSKHIKTTDNPILSEENSFIDFSFNTLYNFLDIDSDDIAAMHKEVDWLFSQFSSRTQVPAFSRLTKRIKGYFQSHRYIARAYEDSLYLPLQPAYNLGQTCDSALVTNQELLDISVQTQEAKIALITYNLALCRDFKPVLLELTQAFGHRSFIHLYGLILSDINYLQFTKTLRGLKDQVLSRLERIWRECFEWKPDNSVAETQQQNSRHLERRIGTIAYLLFGLGIATHYESRANLGEISVKDLLFCKKSPEEWLQDSSQFMWAYFSDERIPYFIAFLLRNLYPKLPQLRSVDRHAVDELNSAISNFKTVFFNYHQTPEQSNSILSKSRIQLINNNLDAILLETGKHRRHEKHQTIRYLHREVLRPKEGHNPIFTNISILLRELEDFFEQYQEREGQEVNSDVRFQIGSGKILTKLDDALSGTASLPIVTETVRQLFYFTPSERVDRERYTSMANQNNSFTRDVEYLVTLLTDMRLRRSFSYSNYKSLRRYSNVIRNDFYGSKLRDALQSYIISLDALLEKTLHEVDERLNKEGFQDLLQREYEQICELRHERYKPILVLCDYYLLQETLRNIFYNLRYSFPEVYRNNIPENAVKIFLRDDVRFIVQPDNQSQDGVVLGLHVQGDSPRLEDFRSSEKTIADQLFKLQEFGAQWNFNRTANSFTLELTFVSRSWF